MFARVYSVLDRKVREFGPLMLERTEESMIRSLLSGVRDNPTSLIGKYPEDFDLYHVANFDPETGKVVPEDSSVLVGNVADIVARFAPANPEGV